MAVAARQVLINLHTRLLLRSVFIGVIMEDKAFMKDNNPESKLVLDRKILSSHAYRKLSPAAKCVLFEFYARLTTEKVNGKWIITNNGKIHMTYESMQEMGFKSKSTCSKIITELVEQGFIFITHTGSKIRGDKSLYALINLWKIQGYVNNDITNNNSDINNNPDVDNDITPNIISYPHNINILLNSTENGHLILGQKERF